jgi:hypothetical protein
MTNTAVPLRSTEEVARSIGNNIKSILSEQGRNLEWLADEIGISVQTILNQFGSKVEGWLTLDAAFYLNVSVDRILEAR